MNAGPLVLFVIVMVIGLANYDGKPPEPIHRQSQCVIGTDQ